jgi:hypothetical protein
MPATCSHCRLLADRYTTRRDPATHAWLVTCHVCAKPRHAGGGCLNPFAALTLTHARDELDQPIQVSSLRQLRQAEQRYHFKSVVANSDERGFDTPPSTRTPDLFEQMSQETKWLYPDVAESLVREMREAGEL